VRFQLARVLVDERQNPKRQMLGGASARVFAEYGIQRALGANCGKRD